MPADHARPDVRERIAGRLLRLLNPLTSRLISAGLPTGAPNVLLTVRGRRSGKLHTVPVGMLELEGRRFVQAAYSEGGWAANLRVARQAIITDHDRREPVHAIQLPPDEAGAVLRRALEPYRRSRALRTLVGPGFRPPAVVLRQLGVRVNDTPDEYAAEARRHPLFELRPR